MGGGQVRHRVRYVFVCLFSMHDTSTLRFVAVKICMHCLINAEILHTAACLGGTAMRVGGGRGHEFKRCYTIMQEQQQQKQRGAAAAAGALAGGVRGERGVKSSATAAAERRSSSSRSTRWGGAGREGGEILSNSSSSRRGNEMHDSPAAKPTAPAKAAVKKQVLIMQCV